MFNINDVLSEAMLAAAKSELDGGFIFIFAGAAPAVAADALNMSTTHTQLAKLTLDNDGVTGLTFDAASGYVLSKPSGDSWEGLVAFDGFEDTPGTLTPTFFRFCASGDDGRAAASGGARLQGTVGGPASTADMKLGSNTLTDNGIDTTFSDSFNFRLGAAG